MAAVEEEFGHWTIVVIATLVGVMMASGSGTGGGAIYTAIYLFVFRDPHRAVPFSKITIFGVAVTSFIINIRKRHPKSDRPLINFQVAALLEPPTLFGAILGVFFNLLLPSVILLSLLAFVLCLTTYKTLSTGIRQFKQEEQQQQLPQQQQQALMENVSPPSPLISPTNSKLVESPDDLSGPKEFLTSPSDSSPGEFTALLVDSPSIATGSDHRHSSGRGDVSNISVSSTSTTPEFLRLESSPLTKRHIETGAPLAPRTIGTFSLDESRDPNSRDSSREDKSRRLASASTYMAHMAIEAARGFVAQPQTAGSDTSAAIFLVTVWTINFFLLSVSGGPQAIACGSLVQKSIVYILLLALAICLLIYVIRLYRLKARREEMGILEPKTEMGGYSWVTKQGLILYPLVACLAGICAGAVGIGGGLIKGPLMIHIGLDPLSAVTTALYMILFTSATTSLSFALSGRLRLFPSLLFFSIAIVGSIIGIWSVNAFVKKYKRHSLITLFLGTVIFISMVCLIFAAVVEEMDVKHTKPLTLHDACQFLKSHDIRLPNPID